MSGGTLLIVLVVVGLLATLFLRRGGHGGTHGGSGGHSGHGGHGDRRGGGCH